MFLDADMALIEGYKRSEIPKIIVLDKDEKILEDVRNKALTRVLAIVGAKAERPNMPADQAYFHWDDLEGIQECILTYMHQQVQKVPLYGLVLAGGKSTRMKKDKSMLEYHGKTQVEHCYSLLTEFCDHVYVSNRQEQAELGGHKPLPQVHDTFLNVGPMGGILSAMRQYPQAAWLVLACDLPFLKPEVIQTLIDERHPFKYATAYQSIYNAFPEPLCAIYEPKIFPRLLQFLANGGTCPRKVLINSDIKLLRQSHKESLENVNHPEEYQKVMEGMNKE